MNGAGHGVTPYEPDEEDLALARAACDEMRAAREARMPPVHARAHRRDWAEPGEGQACFVCGVTLRAGTWELAVIDGHHRFVCAGNRSRLCGMRAHAALTNERSEETPA